MPKIDVTKIEGYEDMTPEQKLEALQNYEYEDHSDEVEKYKATASKANGEAAEWKKKHRELLSEEEQKSLAAQEKMEALEKELAELRLDKTIAQNKANFTALGYDEALAAEAAEALAKGATDKVFACQKKFTEQHDKAVKATLLKQTPAPAAGGVPEGMTLDKFQKLSPAERLTYSEEHPEEYKKLYGGSE